MGTDGIRAREEGTPIPGAQDRTAALLGEDGVRRLSDARVAVIGVGGVGGYVCEALARAGVGRLDLVDGDTVAPTDLNRQITALCSTLGRPKAEVMAERVRDINPACAVRAFVCPYTAETADLLDLSAYDYVADAADSVPAKAELAVRCREAGVPIIAAAGAGNRQHPERFRVGDLSETRADPLARAMRREMGRRGLRHLPVVWSDEPPTPARTSGEGVPATGSLPFVPPVMGLLMAGVIIRALAAPPDPAGKEGPTCPPRASC